MTRVALTFAAALALATTVAQAAQAKSHAVRCVGGASACTATIPLAGLRSQDQIVVNLTDTDLQLASITPSSAAAQGAYGFGRLHMRLGGSQFVAEILIDPPVPTGASVRLRFAVPPPMTSCGNLSFSIDDATIRLNDVAARGLTCTAAGAVAQGCVSGTGPGQGWTALQVDRNLTLTKGRQRVSFALGNTRASCAPSG